MKNLKRLWIVTYRLESVVGKRAKARFSMYEDDCSGEKEYHIQNDTEQVNKKVSKEEGNDYFKSILNFDKNAIVNRII